MFEIGAATSKKRILLHGGGIDSTLLLHELREGGMLNDLGIVFFDYGHLAALAEDRAIERQVRYLYGVTGVSIPVMRLSGLHAFESEQDTCQLFTGNLQHSAELSGRNAAFVYTLSKVVRYAGSDKRILLGVAPVPDGKEHMADCTEKYWRAASAFLPTFFKIELPLLKLSHSQYTTRVRELYRDEPMMQMAATCWNPKPVNNEWKECGVCDHCKKKAEYLNPSIL